MNQLICVLAMVGTVILAGCNGAAPQPEGPVVEIEVLGFDSCPNTPAFLDLVERAAREVGGFRVSSVDQESLPPKDLRRGYPAPTALVGGEDLFGLARPNSPAMGCRMYPGGLPSVEAIAERLTALRP